MDYQGEWIAVEGVPVLGVKEGEKIRKRGEKVVKQLTGEKKEPREKGKKAEVQKGKKKPPSLRPRTGRGTACIDGRTRGQSSSGRKKKVLAVAPGEKATEVGMVGSNKWGRIAKLGTNDHENSVL